MKPTTAIAAMLGLALWLGGGTVRADVRAPTDPAAGAVTESDAVERALARSQRLQRLADEEAAQAKAVDAAATSFADPQLRLEDLSTRYADPDVNHQVTVGLRWSPPRVGELPAREQKERVELWARKVRTVDLRARLASEARKAFAQLDLLRGTDALAQARVGLEEKRCAAVDALVSLGQRPLLDRVKAARSLVKARRDAARARQRLADADLRFAEMTGIAAQADLAAGDPPDRDVDGEAVRRVAIARRPELELARQRARLADREWAAERNRLAPWFSFVEVGYVHESQKPDWGELRLGIDLPFSRWNLSRVRAAAIAQRAGATEGAAALEAVDQELSGALARYREALAALRSLRADDGGLGKQADDLLAAARQDRSLAADDRASLELSDLDERQMVLDARYDVRAAAADLCQAAGVERWEDLVADRGAP